MLDDTSTTQTSESSAPPTAAADSLASPAAGNAASENAENQAPVSENPETPPNLPFARGGTDPADPALAAADAPESRTAQMVGNEPLKIEKTPPNLPLVRGGTDAGIEIPPNPPRLAGLGTPPEEGTKLEAPPNLPLVRGGTDVETPPSHHPQNPTQPSPCEGEEFFGREGSSFARGGTETGAETAPDSIGINNTPRPPSASTPLDRGDFVASPEKEENQQDLQAKRSFLREFLAKGNSLIQSRKRKKLDKVMTLFLKHSKITNDEVEKLLHVSDATATRLLAQLEKENRIRQVGKTGHAVWYEKV